MKRVCHMTSAHPPGDIRIFHKECLALHEMGLEVYLLAPGENSDSAEGIKIVGLQKFKNRFIRILLYPWIILFKAFRINAGIYHFHDPELLIIGLVLKLAGKKVVYDVHENVPLQVTRKYYLIGPFRRLLAKTVGILEELGVGWFDATIVATESIQERFPSKYSHRITVVRNYVDPGEIKPASFSQKSEAICYVGGISYNRGVDLIVKSMENTTLTFHLAGKFHSDRYLKKVQKMKGWENVNYLGVIDRQGIRKVYDDSLVGMLLLRPRDGFRDSLPIKLFEYMAAGIPVLASEFPLWKKIIEDNDCGICIDPLNISAIGDSIKELVHNKEKAEEMGKKGRKLVEERYNWHYEKERLKNCYTTLIHGQRL